MPYGKKVLIGSADLERAAQGDAVAELAPHSFAVLEM
jgi:hypothetical protein